MEMAEPKQGFEEAPELAHVDFANRYIGGGVLSGGCVQEEIRFAICPENVISLLVCPVMLDEEAIQITGAEQFSKYIGYGFRLGYGGDHKDESRVADNGSVLTSILAMDALDFRRVFNPSIEMQLHESKMLRELNKAHAAFVPVNELSLQTHPMVATGNWGCGAFLGCAPLKALIQWAAASQCNRRLRYFPFDETFGPELEALAGRVVNAGGTVGSLLRGLAEVRDSNDHLHPGNLFKLFESAHARENRGSEALKRSEATSIRLARTVHPLRC